MNKRLVILGGGESGTGAALLARKMGYDTFVSDSSSLKDDHRNELQESGIAFEEGIHSEEKILNADEVIKSPGPRAPWRPKISSRKNPTTVGGNTNGRIR